VTLLESAPFSYKACKHVIPSERATAREARDIKKQVLRSRCALAQDDKARVVSLRKRRKDESAG
jgi:hypothetical protein